MSWMQVSVLVFVLLPDTALAGGRPATPKGPPPRFAVVLSLKGQELRVREFCIQPRAHLFRMELKNRRWVTQAVAEQVVSPEQYRLNTLQYSLASCRFFDGKGRKVAPPQAAKWLQPGHTLLLSADGKSVDPLYLEILKENTVLLVCPKDAPPARQGKQALAPAEQKPMPQP